MTITNQNRQRSFTGNTMKQTTKLTTKSNIVHYKGNAIKFPFQEFHQSLSKHFEQLLLRRCRGLNCLSICSQFSPTLFPSFWSNYDFYLTIFIITMKVLDKPSLAFQQFQTPFHMCSVEISAQNPKIAINNCFPKIWPK